MPEKKPKPKKRQARAHTEEDIARVLKQFKGMQCLTADFLGICDSTLSEAIKKSAYLTHVRDACVERRIDWAELNLSKLVEEENDLGAICFFLKTRAKHRGYTESNNVANVTPETEKSFADLMDFLTKNQLSSSTAKIKET